MLREAFGASNAVLTMAVALAAPTGADGAPCARLTVGNETRAWAAEGDVALFDDSLAHTLRNDCDEPLALFHLLLEHPRLEEVESGSGRRDL